LIQTAKKKILCRSFSETLVVDDAESLMLSEGVK